MTVQWNVYRCNCNFQVCILRHPVMYKDELKADDNRYTNVTLTIVDHETTRMSQMLVVTKRALYLAYNPHSYVLSSANI